MSEQTNPYRSPPTTDQAQAPAAKQSVCPAPSGAYWVPIGIGFPDRCVKCNADAGGYQLLHAVSWRPSWVYWLLILGLVPCFVAMMITTKQTSYRIGLCQSHRRRRRNFKIVCCAVLSLCLFGIGYPILSENLWLGVASGTVAVVTLITLAYGSQVISATAITDEAVAVRGLGKEFVRSVSND